MNMSVELSPVVLHALQDYRQAHYWIAGSGPALHPPKLIQNLSLITETHILHPYATQFMLLFPVCVSTPLSHSPRMWHAASYPELHTYAGFCHPPNAGWPMAEISNRIRSRPSNPGPSRICTDRTWPSGLGVCHTEDDAFVASFNTVTPGKIIELSLWEVGVVLSLEGWNSVSLTGDEPSHRS